MNVLLSHFRTWLTLLVVALMLGLVPQATAQSPGSTDSPAPDVPADWWAAVQSDIARAEYSITWQEHTPLPDLLAAYQAPNRAGNLRTYFAPAGPILVPRVWPEGATEAPWRLDLRLQAWGRDGAVQTVTPAALDVVENRIEYRRGPVVEWYRNDAEGVALGFRVDTPAEEGAGTPLQVVMAWGGGLTAQGGDGPGVAFAAGDQVVARLGALTAHDSTGRALPVSLSVTGETLTWRVDDAEATYPIEVTAAITGLPLDSDWSLTWGSANTDFGFAVASAGDVNGDGRSDVIVGAPGYDGGEDDEGRVFMFFGHPLGLSYTPQWTKESNQANARFGDAVASAGDVNGDGYADVIVGAPEYDHPEGEEGGAWVYHGSSTGMVSVPAFFAQSDVAGAQMGYSVASAGDVNADGYAEVIVGGRYYEAGEIAEGAVWVWYGSADGVNGGENGFPANADWHAESNQVAAHLGISVAAAGDVNADGYADVIAGANDYGGTDAGAAWVWHGSENGVNGGAAGTPANAAWAATGATSGAHFGRSVATAGDVNGDGYADVIVGAPHHTNGQTAEGAAYLYLGSEDGVEDNWDNQDEGNLANAWFGQSVACAGDVNGDGYADVVVGAPLYTNDQTEEGRAFLWYGSASGISPARDWWDEGDSTQAWYGSSVATAGDINGDGYSDLIVGAYGAGSQAGSAYVYHGGPDMPSETANWSKRSNLEDSEFGFSVGTAGDVDGDGYADIIAGAPLWDAGQVDEGGAWVYRGSATGLISAPHWYQQGDQAGAQFGYSVATAGDVDGDGCSDVIVGAPFYDSPQEDEGGVWLFYGSAGGVSATAGWVKESDQAGAHFGYDAGTAGDVNGDGYGDVIAGAPGTDHGETDEGTAWLYLGSEDGLAVVPAWHVDGEQAYAEYGTAVATAGDVNADGYSDVVVGAPFWEDDALNEGRIWVYHGSRQGLNTTATWHAEANLAGARLGHSVATAGDVNGDGYSDVIAGAPYWGDGGLSSEGRVWVFYGSGQGVTSADYWYKESNQNYAYYGYSVASAGDVNGDGLADILIGAPAMDRTGGEPSEGLVRLYLGSYSGVESSYAWTAGGEQPLPWYGVSVGTAGDVNGDGYADFVVGAKDYTAVVPYEGAVLVYYGNGRSGLSLRLRQYRDSGQWISPLGMSDGAHFRVYAIHRNPFGGGDIMYEIEVKPLGTRLNGYDTYLAISAWSNLRPGVPLALYSGDLFRGTPYHWRLRVLYSPATTPWMPASRWVTVPWNGWNEEDLRTAGVRVWVPVVFRSYP